MLFAGIIIARMDSSRLPGKVLRELDGMPLISYVVERARRVKAISALVLATTDRAVDDPLASFAASIGIEVFRGSADDVALRVLNCAKELASHFFVRLNADSPFLDPGLIDACSRECLNGYDLVSNLPSRMFPYGISVEWVCTKTFELAYPCMSGNSREHVTQFFYDHPNEYKICSIVRSGLSLSDVRLVVDTQEDFNTMNELMSMLGERKLTADYNAVSQCFTGRWGEIKRNQLDDDYTV
jgi:spore coat polysaccharide biosynthesis protein SpsF